uniref:Bardet-Biedl syndrome 10 n=3 Tax=Nothobranchius korthausae TaxID=1143690 RepID=A0A1A8FBX2_9TELE
MLPMEHIHLKNVLQTVCALESVILRSFGPEGGQVLFTRDTGQVMLSRSGARILTALHLEHPLARMVVECAWKHSASVGDGSKTFILLLASCLRMIHATACKEPNVSQFYNSTGAAEASAARRLADKLLAFALTELDDLIAANVVPHGFCVSLEDFTTKTKLPAHSNSLSAKMLLSSFFHTRLGYALCDFFSDLTCDMLRHWEFKGDQLFSALQFLNDNFPALHTQVSGLPVGSSRLIEGQVIQRDFATPCLQVNKKTVKAVAFTGYLQPKLLNPGDVLELEKTSIMHFNAWTERSVECIIKTLQSLGVSVLFCEAKQSAAVLALATHAGISVVECVSEEELSLFARLSGVTPVSECWMVQPENVATLSFCRPILLGAHRYVHVVFCDSEEGLKPCSLVICAPGEGQADQCAKAIQDASRMLLTTMQPVCLHKTTALNKCESTCLHAASLPKDSANRCDIGALKPGCVIPGGGTFEFLLNRSLLQHHSSVSNPTNTDVHVSRILAKALLIVPRQIYCRNPKGFLKTQTRVMSLISKQPRMCWLLETQNPKPIQAEDPEKGAFMMDTGLDSISCKSQLLLDVLQCVTSLLQVNMMFRTHIALKKPHKITNTSWEQTEDETED